MIFRKKTNILTIIICLSLLFNMVFAPQKAKAWPSVVTTAFTAAGSWFGDVGIFGELGTTIGKMVKDNALQIAIAIYKISALLAVQTITTAIIGDGGGGGTISDWNNYLYISPQQRAMTQMNSFFNTVSRGRLSSLNYEGVGPNYDAYLVTQAKQAINGQAFTTNLQEFATDPTQLFAGGNMKGIMTYMQCANNVACYTLTSTAQYNLEFAKAQEIAKLEQSSGFLPIKKNGTIIQPASIAQSALTQLDQLGTQIIMNASANDGGAAFMQIAAGAGINIASRALNYSTANSQGKAAIRNKNDQFPFSLGYSANGGIGISAGGVNTNTNITTRPTSTPAPASAIPGNSEFIGPPAPTTTAQ